MRNVRHGILVIFGSLLSAVGINMFLVNAQLYSGGVSGIAILIQYATKIPSGYIIGLANIPLLIICYFRLNKRFTVYSVIGTVAYSAFLILTKNMQSLVNIHDTLLYCIYGGLLNGAGIGLAYANHGSMGGFNILSMLIKKKHDSFDVGQIQFAANLVIVLIGVALHGLPTGLYTVISMYISSLVMDKIIHGLSKKKILFVMTDKQEVYDYINANIKPGATILSGRSFTGGARNMLYCVVALAHLPELKYRILNIDPGAILSIVDAAEVDGTGFTTSIL
ncbi:MAG: YitT family protein [Clostridia bacterium]|nr:YitT family protein [Clostridia bacterium]